MPLVLFEKIIMFPLIIVLCSTNVASKIDQWELNGVIPFELGTVDDSRTVKFELIKHEERPVPESFDARNQWSHCKSIGDIAHQGLCGSCWAIVAASTMTDRWCIAKNETFVFSAEDILTCCEYCVQNTSVDRCIPGGHIHLAVAFWAEIGVVSGGPLNSELGCKPYSEQLAVKAIAPQCALTCSNPEYKVYYNEDKHRGTGIKLWTPEMPIKQIQIEIMLSGPVCAVINANKHFEYNAGEGVYQHPEHEDTDYTHHAVKIIGWGVETGVPYWLVANSWGTSWGKMGGFFKILRGKNQLGIEQYAIHAPYVEPDVSNSGLPRTSSINIIDIPAIIVIFWCYSYYGHSF